MQETNDMHLIVWDDLDDPYDHVELAQNWEKVDNHDHTLDKGKQIPTGGLVPESVTANELAPDSVTTVEILNHTILGEDMADGAVGPDQLDQRLFAALVPLGTVIPWYRPNPTFPVPYGWELCDGGSLVQPDHDWTDAGTIDIPDLRDRFIIGAGTGVAERATGGANSRSYAHSHTIPNHGHNIAGHHHWVDAHSHTTPDHSHVITPDGAHSHPIAGGHGIYSRPYEISHGGTPRQALYAAGFNEGQSSDNAPLDARGQHSHGGSTHRASVTTYLGGAMNTNDTSLVTQGVNGTLNTSSTSPGGDTRPAYYGLLYIMKVRKRTIV